jgi:hypothetical protein
LGDGASGERDPEAGNGDGVFLIHFRTMLSDADNVPANRTGRPATRDWVRPGASAGRKRRRHKGRCGIWRM